MQKFILKARVKSTQTQLGMIVNPKPIYKVIECVQCHAIKNTIKSLALDKVKKLRYCTRQIDKEHSYPSLRCVRSPKAEILVEMCRTKLQSLVWGRHVGGPL